MTKDEELMQQALDALEQIRDAKVQRLELLPVYHETIKALKARLAQPEPYAAQASTVSSQTQGRMSIDPVTGDVGIGTVKRQREWQRLTLGELMECKADVSQKDLAFARAIETKLKAKNGY